MNFLKRAIRYCWRQKVRSLILLLTFTLLSTASIICIASGKAAEQGTQEIKETIGASIRIQLDTSQENYGVPENDEYGTAYTYIGDFITNDMIDKISQVPGVVSYNAKSSEGYWGIPDNFEPFPGMVNAPGLSTPYQAVLNSALDINFLNGTYTLAEGRHIQPDDSYVTLISKELADKNNLSVGDKIAFLTERDSTESTAFTIVGIYTGTEGMAKEALMSSDIAANLGYIDINSLDEIYNLKGFDYLDVYINSADEAEQILDTIKNLPDVKGKTFAFQINSEDFDLVSTPLSSMQNMVNTAVTIIAIVGAAIIVLLLLLWTRSRKKEVGILLAVGRCKGEIIGQFLSENLLIAILSIVASSAFSFILAHKIGSLLVSQSGEELSNLAITVALNDMIVVFGIGFLIICLAVAIASYTVIRLKPRDIFTKMD